MAREEWVKFQRGLVASLKAWLKAEHKIGDTWSAVFDPCGGCANFEKDCEGYDHAWICCQGNDFQPRKEGEK